MTYIPHMSDDEVNLRKQWHDALYKKMEDRKAVRMQYLGRRLFVPREVTPPAWMSKLLGKTILVLYILITLLTMDCFLGCGPVIHDFLSSRLNPSFSCHAK